MDESLQDYFLQMRKAERKRQAFDKEEMRRLRRAAYRAENELFALKHPEMWERAKNSEVLKPYLEG